MTVALTSLFKGDVLSEYLRESGEAASALGSPAPPTPQAVARSIHELNKLRSVLE